MNPSLNIARQRQLADEISVLSNQEGGPDNTQAQDIADLAAELAELVLALAEQRAASNDTSAREGAVKQALEYVDESLAELRAWEGDEIESDTDLILDLQGTIIACAGALDLCLSGPTEVRP